MFHTENILGSKYILAGTMNGDIFELKIPDQAELKKNVVAKRENYVFLRFLSSDCK